MYQFTPNVFLDLGLQEIRSIYLLLTNIAMSHVVFKRPSSSYN